VELQADDGATAALVAAAAEAVEAALAGLVAAEAAQRREDAARQLEQRNVRGSRVLPSAETREGCM
jgi:hypothetical protein